MHRIQPLESASFQDDGTAKPKKQVLEDDNRSQVTNFSWDVAVSLFERKTLDRMGKASIYYLDDGILINDERFLTSITREICREFGFELLDVLADLILPVGFGYHSLVDNLQVIVEDAFKPISKTGLRKTIVWIEDENWNASENSLVESLLMKLLLEKTDPFLIAPTKYFDGDVMSTVYKILGTEENSAESWMKYAMLLKFGFLLALRSKTYPLILLHFDQKLSEKVNAFQMLDLAEAEGHEVKYFKNLPSMSDRDNVITNFVQNLVSQGTPTKKIRLDSASDVHNQLS